MNTRYVPVLVALLCFSACTEINLPTTGSPAPNVTVIQQVDSGNSGTTTPRPAPGQVGDGVIYKVKVGTFGGSCKSGTPVAGASTTIPVGCSLAVTATPKVRNPDGVTDRDATELEHGPADSVEWTADLGGDKLVCVRDPANNFNRVCESRFAGPFRHCARVKGIVGCFEGVVQ